MQETSVLLSLAAVFAVALISPGPDVALVVRVGSCIQGAIDSPPRRRLKAGLVAEQRLTYESAAVVRCGLWIHKKPSIQKAPVRKAILRGSAGRNGENQHRCKPHQDAALRSA